MDKIENGEGSKEGEFREKGNWDLNSVTDLVSIVGGCRVQNKNCLILQVEADGNLGKVEGVDNLEKVEEDGNPGKVAEDGNPGKVEEDGILGKVVGDDNPGKMEEDGSLGKDKLQVYKSEMMEKQRKNAYYHLPYHETAKMVECLQNFDH